MNNGADKELLNALLCETNDLLKAVKNRDYIEVGELFDKRQESIDKLKEVGGLGDNPDNEALRISKEILNADRQFLSKLNELKSESGNSVEKVNRKAFGFRMYNSSFQENTTRHLLDKRR